MNQLREPPRMVSPNHLKRLAWLVACIVVGLVVAVIGNAFSASPLWYASIPAAIAIGWLFVANPTTCEPPSRRRGERAVDSKTAS